jgi:mannan endo-1,4-beta-mannosidase
LLLVIGGIRSALNQTLPVNFVIDISRDTLSISPFIYGTNGQSQDRDANIAARRIGGNRLTGYNWENNASNMGMDYNQSNANDNYLTWVAGISHESLPGIVLTTFHDSSRAMGCYSLITLPAAGYVSRDKHGPVSEAEAAPSPRFRQVRMSKGAPFAVQPDTSDVNVYVDEEVNFLVSRYGGAAAPSGVRGYAVDNEPALWPSTHPRIHPGQTTCAEVVSKNVALAKAVKAVDPAAELFGGVFYGFNEHYNMQQAPDWSSYSSYGRYVNAFLASLRDSSTAAGKRLIDVLDLHWYPDLDSSVALNENVDSLHAFQRMQVPRSLWDSSYVEPGWIGKWFSPVSLIPNMKTSVAKYFPGTRLAITEYNYGGSSHISGGVAVTDVLGIFGKYGVYFASHWGAVQGYVKSAFQIFRNYDGHRTTFGDISVHSSTSDKSNSSLYASLRSSDPSKVDLIVINKNFTRTIAGSFTVLGPRQYQSGQTFGFDAASPAITPRSGIPSITGNQYAYSIPPLSVFHFVLSTPAVSVEEEPDAAAHFILEQNYPNPFNPATVVRYSVPLLKGRDLSAVKLAVYDILGREVAVLVNGRKAPGNYEVQFDAAGLASGVYVYRLTAGSFVQTRRMLLVR